MLPYLVEMELKIVKISFDIIYMINYKPNQSPTLVQKS